MNKPFHVIKDPVHGTLQFDDSENAWIKPFIDHPLFQRLRHIKQLGLADLIFPGAVHTRFNHSLGCAYVANQIAHKIGLSDAEKKQVTLAGLLHDIGHGPFSHAFEGLFTTHKISHEEWTPYFLTELESPKNAALLPSIKSMIMHQAQHPKLLGDIVSSQLDADRLDYLLRDSHFCGVAYGTYDFRWMLHSLTRIKTEDGERLGVTYKGIGVVEHYLNARRLMMRNIYHNPKKIALEYWLITLLKQLAQTLEQESFFKKLSEKRIGCFLRAVNHHNQQTHTTPSVFIDKNYDLYKQLCDYDIYGMLRHLCDLPFTHDTIELARRVYLRRLPSLYPLQASSVPEVLPALQNLRAQENFKSWQLDILTLPQQSYSGETDPIWVDQHGHLEQLDSLSMVVSALSGKFEHACFILVDDTLKNHAGIQQLLQQHKLNRISEG